MIELPARRPRLVIVTGPAGSGKTTLRAPVGRHDRLPRPSAGMRSRKGWLLPRQASSLGLPIH